MSAVEIAMKKKIELEQEQERERQESMETWKYHARRGKELADAVQRALSDFSRVKDVKVNGWEIDVKGHKFTVSIETVTGTYRPSDESDEVHYSTDYIYWRDSWGKVFGGCGVDDFEKKFGEHMGEYL